MKNKKQFYVCGLFCWMTLFSVLELKAQETIMDQVNYTQLEHLVELANSNYPRAKVSSLAVDHAKEEVAINKASWFDALGFTVNYFYRTQSGDDRTVIPPTEGGAVIGTNPLFNGFQFGVNLRLGEIAQKPAKIRQARVGVAMAEMENAEYQSLLKSEVKARYYEYLRCINELKIRSQSALDSKNTSDEVMGMFERGEVSLTDYNTARTNHAQANSLKIAAENELLKAKDGLEELIGVKLDQVK